MSDDDDRRRHGLWNRLRRKMVRNRSDSDIRVDADIFIVFLLFGLILLGCLVTLTLAQQTRLSSAQSQINANQARLRVQQRQLTRLELRDRVNSYQAAYRFCTRESIDRAAIHWFLSRRLLMKLPSALRREARKQSISDLHRMERKDGMPVLNCSPNVVGGPATYLPPAAQRRFVQRWRDHKLTPAEIGICKIRIGAVTDPRECLK